MSTEPSPVLTAAVQISTGKFDGSEPMDRTRFVETIRLVVQNAAVTDTISLLSQPPGRRPDERVLRLSAWFNKLASDDRQNLEAVIRMTAHAAVFGFLCVLDGSRAIESGPEKGTLDVRYCRGAETTSPTDDAGELLHELL